MEHILHRLFATAQLDFSIEDRFDNPVEPRAWFLMPIQAIDEAAHHIRDRSITKIIYDQKTARLVSDEKCVL